MQFLALFFFYRLIINVMHLPHGFIIRIPAVSVDWKCMACMHVNESHVVVFLSIFTREQWLAQRHPCK